MERENIMENEEKQGTTEVSQPNQVQTSENKIGDPQTIMRPNPPEEYKEVTSLLKQLESSTNNLGWVVGLSAINVALIVSGVDLNFLFSTAKSNIANIKGIIINKVPFETNDLATKHFIDELSRYTNVPVLGQIHNTEEFNLDEFDKINL